MTERGCNIGIQNKPVTNQVFYIENDENINSLHIILKTIKLLYAL